MNLPVRLHRLLAADAYARLRSCAHRAAGKGHGNSERPNSSRPRAETYATVWRAFRVDRHGRHRKPGVDTGTSGTIGNTGAGPSITPAPTQHPPNVVSGRARTLGPQQTIG